MLRSDLSQTIFWLVCPKVSTFAISGAFWQDWSGGWWTGLPQRDCGEKPFFSHWKRQILIHIQVFLRAMNEEMDNACEKNLKASLQLFHSFTTTRKFSLHFCVGESAALPIRREWNGGNELQKLLCECPFLQFDWNTFPNSRFYHLIMLIYWNMFFWILVQLFLVAKMR